MRKDKCSLAIFASGNGSNAEAIINYLEESKNLEVTAIYSNNPSAYVLQRAKNHGITSHVFKRAEFYDSSYLQKIMAEDFDLIVLAGFMWLIPETLVQAYPGRIINIHPALLPKFGGKGMYGHHVHEAVLKQDEKESGITIHFVNEQYDEGDIILQKSCAVLPGDSPDLLASRIHALEHEYYPKVIKEICQKILA